MMSATACGVRTLGRPSVWGPAPSGQHRRAAAVRGERVSRAPTASVSRFPFAGVATTIAATSLTVSSAQERGVMVALTA
ncbi:hypothetical protein OG734_01795 [Streptomyces sp. NBC_00576]|nr:hypothetical protein [Streptomyces sp. NBC_00576]WUB68921.1 hypothetical protein OG734_01795 [Streptomyces sp. NBC_00576]